ncbi:MAG TPA: hypothetical protein PLV31_05365 [Gammaproteobacteria bacterium]|nr:hypothetical protein [Gammaproteobacteria bacterium]HQZ87459.1 hypothetical protein [Gammaproteobacteria bacterium]HRA43093.1 hypothetical protein [Gammaproteobacteria bacterium]
MIIECTNPKEISFSYKEICNPTLLEYAKNKLSPQGILKQDDSGSYCYLKIQDNFIFELFPFIKEPGLSIPDYFPPRYDTGAHISVIYPEEIFSEKINIEELAETFSFEPTGLLSVSVFNKTFFALAVSSPALKKLRLRYNLPTKLNYRGLLVPFHITIATSAR